MNQIGAGFSIDPEINGYSDSGETGKTGRRDKNK